MIQKAFPGSVPWDSACAMTLEDFAGIYALSVEFIEAKAEALRGNRG